MTKKQGFNLTGDKELRQLFKKTPPHIFNKAVVPASRRAMTPVAKTTKKNITAAKLRGSGLLRKSIGIKAQKYNRQGNVWVGVGPRLGFRQVVTTKDGITMLRNPIKYMHLVEHGFRSRSGQMIPGRAYLASAMLSHQRRMESQLASELGTEIPKRMARLNKQKKT